MVVKQRHQLKIALIRLLAVLERRLCFHHYLAHKVNENGENLQGAEFEVVRDRSGAVVGKLTTDSNGNANLGDLLRDDCSSVMTPPARI